MVIKTRTKKREILVKLKILQFDGKKTHIFFNILVLSENGRNILKSMILIHSIWFFFVLDLFRFSGPLCLGLRKATHRLVLFILILQAWGVGSGKI